MAKKFIFINTNGDEEESVGAYEQADHISVSAGAADAGKPIVLDGGGHVDASMINDGDIDHTLLQNIGTNTHPQIDSHIADASIHFTVASIDHGSISGLGDDDHIIYLKADGSRDITNIIEYDAVKNFSGANPQAIPDKNYVDTSIAAAVTGSAAWKWLALSAYQFADGNTISDGIKQAGAIFLTSNPVAGDTVVTTVDGGSTSRTYSFVTGGDVTVSIGGNAAASAQNLVAAIMGDSSRNVDAYWVPDALDELNPGGVIVLVLKDGTAIPVTGVCGVYGTWTTQGNFQVINFANGNYENSVATTAPTTYANNFGQGSRATLQTPNEAHPIRDNDKLGVWDGDAKVWVYIASPGAYTASLGVEIVGGNIQADLAPGGGLKIVGTELAVEPADFAGQGLIDDGSDNLAIDWSTTYNDSKAVKASDLSSTASGKGASIIGVQDAAGYYAGTNVEAALAEIGANMAAQGVVYTAGAGGVAKGDLVYISANNTVLPYATLTDAEYAIGIVLANASAGNPCTVLMDDVILTGILSGATAGDKYYWNGGGLQSTLPTGSGKHIWQAGVAKNATDLHVEIRLIMKRS